MGAYRPAPVSTLETEAYVPPLNLYLDSMVARATQRLEDSRMAAKIEGACWEVSDQLLNLQYKKLNHSYHP